MKVILHIDFNSYFATVEQQANPKLRGKPVGVTGGDRMTRTVLGAASSEAKKFGVKTGMTIPEALKLCPQIILVKGDSDKYLSTTQKFLNILKDYTPYLEIFSIDEVFIEIVQNDSERLNKPDFQNSGSSDLSDTQSILSFLKTAQDIKDRIKKEIGDYITCSIGISYNKLMAKLAGSLYKPDGLVVIADEKAASRILDQVELDEICGIGPRIKRRLNNMGIFNFKHLRQAPLEALVASFKSYGQTLFNMARGIDNSPIVPFYAKEEVKSVGHRHTLSYDTADIKEIKQILLKLTELIAQRLRAKKLVGKTVNLWFRYAFNLPSHMESGKVFVGDGMQTTVIYTNDGLEIFKAAWGLFLRLWDPSSGPTGSGQVRMIGVSVSNLKPTIPQNLKLFKEDKRVEIINKTLDYINNRYGNFTLQRGILLNSTPIRRQPNPFLADRRFKL